MNKTFLLLVLALSMLAGCASLDKKVQSYTDNSYKLAKDGSGIVYGAFGTIVEVVSVNGVMTVYEKEKK